MTSLEEQVMKAARKNASSKRKSKQRQPRRAEKLEALGQSVERLELMMREFSLILQKQSDQISVISRLLVQNINNLNKEDPITEKTIEEAFKSLYALKKRDDFKLIERKWFMGESVPDQPQEPEPSESATEPELNGVIFGGDYDPSKSKDQIIIT